MSQKISKTSPGRTLLYSLGEHFAYFLVVASLLGWVEHHSAAYLSQSTQPAGFAKGILQGATMPLAMPNLIVGDDVTIYAPVNTGRSYKFGYTLGVNGCGLLFFGYFFWRVNRLRKAAFTSPKADPPPASGND